MLPLQFPQGHSADTLGLSGAESFDITGLDALNHGEIPDTVHVTATSADGKVTQFDADVRIDTQGESHYYINGGIMQYVLRNLARA